MLYCISFINKTIKYRIIKNSFRELNKNDYDFLMVNSDQTWRKSDKFFYDFAFLRFAKKWNIPKFIYGASLGYDYWTFTKEDEKVAKECLKNFTGISIRENGTINLIEKHLGIHPILVLDPTLIIDKKYYINLIKHYKNKIKNNDNIIFTYFLFYEKNVIKFVKDSCNKLGYKNNSITIKTKNSIEKFILGIVNSKAVITDSYHGTLFSIIFNKPFVSFINKNCGKERFISLKKILNLENRIVNDNIVPNISLLTTPLKINNNILNSLKDKSINFLKKNLHLKINEI